MAAGFDHCSHPKKTFASKGGSDSQQPLQVAIASKLSNLATKVTNKVRSRIRTNESSMDREIGGGDCQHSDHDAGHCDSREDPTSSGASTPRGDVTPSSPFAAMDERSPSKVSKADHEESEGKAGLHKIIGSKAEAWIAKKGLSWPWKGCELDGNDLKNRFSWPWLHGDHDGNGSLAKAPDHGGKPEENNRLGNNEAPGSWSSLNANSTSSVSSNGSTSSSVHHKLDLESDCIDYEIAWEDLTIGEQIGQGENGICVIKICPRILKIFKPSINISKAPPKFVKSSTIKYLQDSRTNPLQEERIDVYLNASIWLRGKDV
ncbi:hypothetical protein KSP40_PGU018470 [Platanthera guangdongensis]|uniref:Uncharacterized protein n=1 Tax=Platanthera guangdongensis TaxID=2320717 RepID=A0ABR2MY70_9ASPA